jgi:hypothetical protein
VASLEDCIGDANTYVIFLNPSCRSRDYAVQFLLEHGNGPEGAGAFGTAAYANVPTRPTNRSNALSERFIILLLSS